MALAVAAFAAAVLAKDALRFVRRLAYFNIRDLTADVGLDVDCAYATPIHVPPKRSTEEIAILSNFEGFLI